MNSSLQFLTFKPGSEALRATAGISSFFGLATSIEGFDEVPDSGVGTQPCVVDVSALASAPSLLQTSFTAHIRSLLRPVLFLVTAVDVSTLHLLEKLSAGRIQGLNLLANPTRLTFSAASRPWSKGLAGQTFDRDDSSAIALGIRPQAALDELMRLDGQPTFVTWTESQVPRYVWATPDVFDAFATVDSEYDLERRLDKILPLLIFLRETFGVACWHNPEATAALTIDDPLLQPNYGFINFRSLLLSARTHGFHVSLAFIPWNSWRTRERDAALFREFSDVFSLCVHGCDHTNNEYGVDDHGLLLDKNHRALDRMELHSNRTGIPFTPIAVCPQERCSLAAWRAFADHPSMLALMNTRTMPRVGSGQNVKGANLLLPAQDSLFGFPAFKRHYPGSMSRFALNLYLGKPAILVEHHDYFRDGQRPIEEFAASLRQINPAVQWRSLEQVTITAHLRRQENNDATAIRFFTHRFEFTPTAKDSRVIQLKKRVGDPTRIRAFRVDGVSIPFAREGEFVRAEITTEPDRRVRVYLEPEPLPARTRYSFGLSYRTGVATRRLLSEMRDNYVSHSPLAVKYARSILRLANLTAEPRRPSSKKVK